MRGGPAVREARPGEVQPLSLWTLFVTKGGLRVFVLYLSLAALFYMRARRDWQQQQQQQHDDSSSSAETTRAVLCKNLVLIQSSDSHFDLIGQVPRALPAGVEGVRQLKQTLPDNIQLVVACNIPTALNTAELMFEKTRVLASNDCRVQQVSPRRTLQELQHDFPKVDFSIVTSDSSHLASQNDDENPSECQLRARKFVDWLIASRPEENIALVGEASFLNHLTIEEGLPPNVLGQIQNVRICR